MKNKLFRHKPKRTTFWKMFAKAMILPIIVTVALSYCLTVFIRLRVVNDVSSSVGQFQSEYLNRTLRTDINGKIPEPAYISMFGNLYPEPEGGAIDPITWVEPEYKAVTFTFDKDGNIIDSNSGEIVIVVRMSEVPGDREWYYCDPMEYDIPELKEFCKKMFSKNADIHNKIILDITSLYINAGERKMIPHTIEVTEGKVSYGYMDYGFWTNSSKIDKYEVTINADVEGYELTYIYSRNDKEKRYPCGSIQGIFGCSAEQFNEMYAECSDDVQTFIKGTGSQFFSNSGDPYMKVVGHTELRRLYSDDERYGICSYVVSDVSHLRSWYRMIIIMFLLFAFMTFIAFLICWRKNVKNKAQYAFEDYQRALTNNLAHDLKTPLAVIGGYAENLIEMRKEGGGEKELRYLASIMDNVAYTDSIIAKTLRLSETEQTKELNKVKVDIKALAEKLAEKYKAALEERGIELTVTGGGEITADEDTLISAAENLISNAVKYTRDDGTIKITADKKRLTVVNDVAEDVDTKDLTMPFVKGDKARSDKSSSGLGLAIASAAAERNGFGLKVSCKDKRFTAEIIFR